jgi:hypothetical protein
MIFLLGLLAKMANKFMGEETMVLDVITREQVTNVTDGRTNMFTPHCALTQ